MVAWIGDIYTAIQGEGTKTWYKSQNGVKRFTLSPIRVVMEQILEKFAEQMRRLEPGDQEEREMLVSQLAEVYCGEMFDELAETTSLNYIPIQYAIREQSRK